MSWDYDENKDTEKEYVEVTVRIPKSVYEYIKKRNLDINKFVNEAISYYLYEKEFERSLYEWRGEPRSYD